MIKMMVAICRRPGMTHAEYLAYIQYVHGGISNEVDVGLKRYVQNHVFDGAFGQDSDRRHALVVSRDSVTELYWNDAQQMAATFGHEHVRAKVNPDGPRFAEVETQLAMVATEHERSVAHPARAAGAKVMHFLRARDGLALPTFFQRWADAHDRIMAADGAAAQALRRCVHSHQLSDFNAMLSHFGGKTAPYEGVSSLWFDDVTSVNAFRTYERALLEINADPASAFYEPSQSFFVYARETTIYETYAW